MADNVTLCSSPLWQFQYVGVAIILARVKVSNSFVHRIDRTDSAVDRDSTGVENSSSSAKRKSVLQRNNSVQRALGRSIDNNQDLDNAVKSSKLKKGRSSRFQPDDLIDSSKAKISLAKTLGSLERNKSMRADPQSSKLRRSNSQALANIDLQPLNRQSSGLFQLQSVDVLEELSKNGYLRSICLLLAHRKFLIRELATEVCFYMMLIVAFAD